MLDPFMGSGTTAVAAVQAERHFAGYEVDPAYAKAARMRVAGLLASPRLLWRVNRGSVLQSGAECMTVELET